MLLASSIISYSWMPPIIVWDSSLNPNGGACVCANQKTTVRRNLVALTALPVEAIFLPLSNDSSFEMA